MSYDLMVFKADAAPKDKDQFIEWYKTQSEWSDDYDYNDPEGTAENLRNWFFEIIKTFPAMNGPFRSDDLDDPKISDYTLGPDLIYVAFAWSEAENAYNLVTNLAAKHGVGFFDVSGTNDVFVPDGRGELKPLNAPGSNDRPWWKFW